MINEKEILNSIINFKVYSPKETAELICNYARLKRKISNYKDGKVVYLVVGPSGSGKSTMIANLYANNVFGNSEGNYVPFVNRFYDNPNCDPNDSRALEAEKNIKNMLLKKGKSFLIESAKFDQDYLNYIKEIKLKYNYQICTLYLSKRYPMENLMAVKNRVEYGGHGTQETELNINKLKEMYVTDGTNLKYLLPISDCAFVVRNTTVNQKEGKPVILRRKTLDGYYINGDILKYQIEYRKIIHPFIAKSFKLNKSGVKGKKYFTKKETNINKRVSFKGVTETMYLSENELLKR